MPRERTPSRLNDRRGGSIASPCGGRCRAIAVLTGVLVTLWVGTYLYFRARHSLGGVYAAAPLAWKQINYDEHYPWGKPLFYLHQPLAWFDQRITGTEVR